MKYFGLTGFHIATYALLGMAGLLLASQAFGSEAYQQDSQVGTRGSYNAASLVQDQEMGVLESRLI